MNDQDPNFLWNPEATGASPDLRVIAGRLQEFSACRRGLMDRAPPVPASAAITAAPTGRTARGTARRRGLAIAGALAAALFIGLALHLHLRLQWAAARPWPVQVSAAGQAARTSTLAVGQALDLSGQQRALLQVAGIGRVQLEPGSRLRLLETSSGQHRVELQQGRMKARIWAPPGHFGVVGGGALLLDLGCEFELDIDPDRNGRLAVLSGWVQLERGGHEILVPQGYRLDFDAQHLQTPVRVSANPDLRRALLRLDQALRIGTQVDASADTAAALAEHADVYSLLSLLTRHPELARTQLYPRLSEALDRPLDARERAAWAAGDSETINRAWQRLPQPPKAWWRHWRDAL